MIHIGNGEYKILRIMLSLAQLLMGSSMPDRSKVRSKEKTKKKKKKKKKGCPGPRGWGLSVGTTTLPDKKDVLLRSF